MVYQTTCVISLTSYWGGRAKPALLHMKVSCEMRGEAVRRSIAGKGEAVDFGKCDVSHFL